MSKESRLCWAKSKFDPISKGIVEWLPLYQHMIDSGEVAREYLKQQVSRQEWRTLDALGVDRELISRVIEFVIASHDIGKATPTFACKSAPLMARMQSVGFHFDALAVDQSRLAPHNLTGWAIMRRWLESNGVTSEVTDFISGIVASHHGLTPDQLDLNTVLSRPKWLGEGKWVRAQNELLRFALNRVGLTVADVNQVIPQRKCSPLISGMTVACDWLASNTWLFPLVEPNVIPEFGVERIQEAWRKASLPRSWYPEDSLTNATELLNTRFDFESQTVRARPLQETGLKVSRECDAPGLVIIEAPMGEGKTEAAFLMTEVLAARSGARGSMIVLPTQATTDAMFQRQLKWLSKLPKSQTDPTGRHYGALMHGKAYMNNTYQELFHSSHRIGQMFEGESSPANRSLVSRVRAHWWLADRKKSPLSDFVVGTVDQLLFMALQSRHVMLRHLGVAGKVVVIDEVHACDAYMLTYLNLVLEWLGAYGVPVILMSATLTAKLRDDLLDSYLKGTGQQKKKKQFLGRLNKCETPVDDGVSSAELAASSVVYPRITYTENGVKKVVPIPPSDRSLLVEVEIGQEDDYWLVESISKKTIEGGNVLVVCNTVSRAQNAYRLLNKAFGDHAKTMLLHSRFLGCDRLQKEGELLKLFGPSAAPWKRGETRIVVATQVVEQSLDLDFDLIITDLAPMDILFQRIGRLHRRNRHRPEAMRKALCIVRGIRDVENLLIDPGALDIYPKAPLYRTFDIINDRVASNSPLQLPNEISDLVEAAYDDRDSVLIGKSQVLVQKVREGKIDDSNHMAEQQSRAKAFRLYGPNDTNADLIGWLSKSAGDVSEVVGEGYAQVRDIPGSLEIEVLVVVDAGNGCFRLPSWVVGEELADVEFSPDMPPTGEVLDSLLRCTLKIRVSGQKEWDYLIKLLEQNYYPAWQQIPGLKGQLILSMGEIEDEELVPLDETLKLYYKRNQGLLKVKKKGGSVHGN